MRVFQVLSMPFHPRLQFFFTLNMWLNAIILLRTVSMLDRKVLDNHSTQAWKCLSLFECLKNGQSILSTFGVFFESRTSFNFKKYIELGWRILRFNQRNHICICYDTFSNHMVCGLLVAIGFQLVIKVLIFQWDLVKTLSWTFD